MNSGTGKAESFVDWFNRLTRSHALAPSAPFIPGQWEYRGEGIVRIRDAEAHPSDLLLPNREGRVSVNGAESLRVDPHLIPDEDALHRLRLAGQRFIALDGRPWSEWAHMSPLLPPNKDSLDSTPLELQLAEKIGYLEAVCHRPRAHLRVDEERQHVSRCKRASVRAPAVLSARSEDWARRTLWGIEPRRILGLVREDLVDIYENRITVGLIDRLDKELALRIRSVRRILQMFEQRESYQHVLENSTNYRRARRVLGLWGEAVEDEVGRDLVQQAYRRIQHLRRRLLSLKDSPLYREIGGRRTGRIRLRMTNVLSNDATYRRIAELWMAWESHVTSQRIDPNVEWRRDQEAARALDDFMLLVLVRALDALGYKPADASSELGAAFEFDLIGPAGALRLRRGNGRFVVESAHADHPLHVVTMPAMLDASVTISPWCTTAPPHVLIATLPADRPRAPPDALVRLRSLGNEGDGPGAMFVAIAPWDLESTERVARALRWYAWSALYSQYPFKAPAPDGWNPSLPLPGWARPTGRSVEVTRPPAANELAWKALEERAAEAELRAVEADDKLAACDKKARKRLHLRHEAEAARSEANSYRDAVARVDAAICSARRLLQCPVCETISDTHSFQQTGVLFRARCPDCGASWGTQTCAGCEQPFPFLTFSGHEPADSLLDLDRRYGADVLAIPLPSGGFMCPHCGTDTEALSTAEAPGMH